MILRLSIIQPEGQAIKLNVVYNRLLLTLRLNLKSQCTIANSISSGQWIVNSFFRLFLLIFRIIEHLKVLFLSWPCSAS